MSATDKPSNTYVPSSSYDETAISLFQRLSLKPLTFPSFPALVPPIVLSSSQSNDNLYADSAPVIRSGSTYEFVGEHASGKTACLIELLTTLLLPTSHGGQDEHVFFIDNDSRPFYDRLLDVMECKINARIESEELAPLTEKQLDAILKQSLERLHIAACHSSMNLLATLKSIELLLKEPNGSVRPRVLMIDNVAAFHYEDRYDRDAGRKRQNRISQQVHSLVQNENLILFTTKPILFRNQMGQGGKDIMPFQWLKEVIQSQLHVYRDRENARFGLRSLSDPTLPPWHFTITDTGIDFV